MALPVLTVEQMRAWEQATWASGQTEDAVIQLVGAKLAERIKQLSKPAEPILLLAGRGHNGDDVRAAAGHLNDRWFKLLNVTDPRQQIAELQSSLATGPSVIVDGLFGIGLSRPLDAGWCEFLELVNQAQAFVIAVDVPSGLHADSGEPKPNAVRADVTLTVGAVKRGLLKTLSADWVGRLEVITDVGLLPCSTESEVQWTEDGDFRGFPPRRPVGGHKGTFGHVAIVAGSLGYHGACVLAARGAQRARPGLLTVFTDAEVYLPIAAQLQAPMVSPWDGYIDASRFTAMGWGPGLAWSGLPSSVSAEFRRCWREATTPIVADASALDWLEPSSSPANSCRVITPHPGEAARLLGVTTSDVQQDRVAALRTLSQRFGCWVVLKGRHSLIGRETGPVFVNNTGDSGLAQGGSGDLLAGFMAGLLAQPAMQTDPLLTIRYAVWEHGRAAERLSSSRLNWTIEELAGELGRVS